MAAAPSWENETNGIGGLAHGLATFRIHRAENGATYDMGTGAAAGDVGTDRPKWVVARDVMVSFRLRLMERID